MSKGWGANCYPISPSMPSRLIISDSDDLTEIPCYWESERGDERNWINISSLPSSCVDTISHPNVSITVSHGRINDEQKLSDLFAPRQSDVPLRTYVVYKWEEYSSISAVGLFGAIRSEMRSVMHRLANIFIDYFEINKTGRYDSSCEISGLLQ